MSNPKIKKKKNPLGCIQCVVVVVAAAAAVGADAVFFAVCERYVCVTRAVTLFDDSFLFHCQRKCITHSVLLPAALLQEC